MIRQRKNNHNCSKIEKTDGFELCLFFGGQRRRKGHKGHKGHKGPRKGLTETKQGQFVVPCVA